MGNTYGRLFRVTTFGESHGVGIGAVIDGCPAGLVVTTAEIQAQLDRRKPGQSGITTPRQESDRVRILSGILNEETLGTPIGLIIENQDARPGAYQELKELYRPGHADFTYDARFGIRDWRGGGRASARETAARVAAGAIARKMLSELAGIEILAWVCRVGDVRLNLEDSAVTAASIEANPVRCPDIATAAKMMAAIESARDNNNSLGGKLQFQVTGCPAGLGAPVFDKLTADLGKACLSIPAARSIGFGVGEKAATMSGLEHNDPFIVKPNGRIGTETNHAGGILGGISNGEMLYGTMTFKPTATIRHRQRTVTRDGETVEFSAGGRHDPCVLPRAVPVVEAMVALVLADHLLRLAVARMSNLKEIFKNNNKLIE
jgi:chorismate synthase